jgi:hypothetical protein
MWDAIWFIGGVSVMVGMVWMLVRAMRDAQSGGRGYSSNDSGVDVWWGGAFGPEAGHHTSDTCGAAGGDGGHGNGSD